MTEEPIEINRELAAIARNLVAINERMAAGLAELLRVLAMDTISITDIAVPGDELEMILLRGARERAEKILMGLGGERQSH